MNRKPSQLYVRITNLVRRRLSARTLGRSVVGTTGLSIVDMLTGLIIAALLARSLGVEGFGLYSVLVSGGVIAAMPAQFGLPSVVLREAARFYSEDDRSGLTGLLAFSALFLLVTCPISIAIYIAMGEFLQSDSAGVSSALVVWASILIPITSLADVVSRATAATRQVVWAEVPGKLIRPVLMATGAYVLLNNHSSFEGVVGAVKLSVLSGTVSLMVSLFIMVSFLPLPILTVRPRVHWREWILSCVRFALLSTVRRANEHFLVVLTGLLGGASASAILRIAQRGANIIQLGSNVLVSASSPRVTHLSLQKSKDRLQQMLTSVANLGALYALLSTAVVAVAGELIISLIFGEAYQAAWVPLMVLASASVILTLQGPASMVLIMLGGEAKILQVQLLAFLVMIVLCVLLVPSFSAAGAAVAKFVGVLIMSFQLRAEVQARYHLNSGFNPRLAWRSLVELIGRSVR